MNKDALLATFIGFVIGLVITGALLGGPGIMKKLPNFHLPNFQLALSGKKPTIAKKPVETNKSTEITFAVSSPTAETIESKSDLLVSGTAVANTMVVIQGYVDEAITQATTDNTFAGKITLQEGKNAIVVTNYIEGKPTTNTMTVYYTPESL
jgi:hypothetical protein